ncbi:hypothetical protein [Allorhizocola rhizosphaerae]|uniref:hypothetical protein n=1 Tax=Allorhizocola rhizosphaerae TaxID=1872709 RepID=UPI001B8C0AA4|nr:hypothetical protein [Allorhizocola rhizosphaerae]
MIAVVGAVLLGGGAALRIVLNSAWARHCDGPGCSAQGTVSTAPSATDVGVSATAATPSESPAASPSPSKSPAGPGLPRPRTGRCPSLAACGFPDASNTGPTVTTFTRHTGNATIRKDGTVISGWDLHMGMLDIYANNVTVTQCKILSNSWWGINLRPGFSGLKVTYCEIKAAIGQGPDGPGKGSDYAISNMSEHPIEVGWNDISGFGNALSMSSGNIHDNYVHDLPMFINAGGEWQHVDAIISGGDDTRGLTIRHNTLLNSATIDKGATAAIGLFPDNGVVSNTLIQDNWLAGGAYAVYGGGKGANGIRVINNVFSTEYWPGCGYYGPVAHWNAGGPGNVWSGNVTSEGKPVNP